MILSLANRFFSYFRWSKNKNLVLIVGLINAQLFAGGIFSCCTKEFAEISRARSRGIEHQEPASPNLAAEVLKPETRPNAIAHYNWARNYEEGQEELRDLNQAVFHYKIAAKIGHAEAQCRLGEMYEEGNEILMQDFSQAVVFYELSEKQGHETAAERKKLLLQKIADIDADECHICQEALENKIFMPCCHKVCATCAPKLNICPFCRSEIWEVHSL